MSSSNEEIPAQRGYMVVDPKGRVLELLRREKFDFFVKSQREGEI
jgi:hypothetical protein